MQTSQGYIFCILQHFATKFCNFTNFNKLFTGIYFFLPKSKISLTCKLSIAPSILFVLLLYMHTSMFYGWIHAFPQFDHKSFTNATTNSRQKLVACAKGCTPIPCSFSVRLWLRSCAASPLIALNVYENWRPCSWGDPSTILNRVRW